MLEKLIPFHSMTEADVTSINDFALFSTLNLQP